MRDASLSKSLLQYYWSELSAIAEFIEEAEEERGGICRYCSSSFVFICRSKTSVSVHSVFPFSYKEWVSSPGLVISHKSLWYRQGLICEWIHLLYSSPPPPVWSPSLYRSLLRSWGRKELWESPQLVLTDQLPKCPCLGQLFGGQVFWQAFLRPPFLVKAFVCGLRWV